MKTLIIHHLESMWEHGYKRAGYSYEELLFTFREYLEENYFSRVILTRFEDNYLEPEHSIISEFITNVYDYAYGWEDCEETNNEDFCDGGSHSEKVLITDWMRELSGEVFISGAFDGECIEDLEIALTHLSVNYTRIEPLII